MHLVVPFASASSPTAAHVASSLALPNLDELLKRWSPAGADEGDDFSLSPPHERALAAAWSWPVADGLLPFAAVWAARDGVRVMTDDTSGWALLSPTHWQVATDQVTLADPASLALDDETSRELFGALRPLFEDDGWSLHWGAATRWYARHASFASLPTASLDRVVSRNVDLWLGRHPDARQVRTLQAEVQMLLHTHPANERRESRGLLPVNSVWLSGTGIPRGVPAGDPIDIDDTLREPALSEDWTAWSDAWRQLDAGPVARLLQLAASGQAAQITLCGERAAKRFEPRPPEPWWQRLMRRNSASSGTVLATL